MGRCQVFIFNGKLIMRIVTFLRTYYRTCTSANTLYLGYNLFLTAVCGVIQVSQLRKLRHRTAKQVFKRLRVLQTPKIAHQMAEIATAGVERDCGKVWLHFNISKLGSFHINIWMLAFLWKIEEFGNNLLELSRICSFTGEIGCLPACHSWAHVT